MLAHCWTLKQHPPLCSGVTWRENCEAQGKGRARGGPRKVTQRSFMDGGWWMVDGGYPFPDALH